MKYQYKLTAQELSFRVRWKFPIKLLTMKINVTYSQTNGLTCPASPLGKDLFSLYFDLTYAKRSIGHIRLNFNSCPVFCFHSTSELLMGGMWVLLWLQSGTSCCSCSKRPKSWWDENTKRVWNNLDLQMGPLEMASEWLLLLRPCLK